MSHERVLTREYTVNAEGSSFVETVNGRMVAVEYTDETETGRFIVVSNNNNFEKNTCTLGFKRQVLVNESWKTIEGLEYAIADDRTYCDDNGITIPKVDALEIVDDFDREILDRTDPDNPVSFSPKKYEQKKVLKDGVSLKIDFYVENLAPSLYPTFTTILKVKYNIAEL